VISLRGKIIPVFDLATRLGLATERAEQAKIVIVETEVAGTASLAGIVVDDVEEVITVAEEQIDAEGGRAVTGAAIEGIAKIDDRLVVLLSPEQVVATSETLTEPAAPAATVADELPSADVAVAA
jgi:purine-binding chemotaxis protein CheW